MVLNHISAERSVCCQAAQIYGESLSTLTCRHCLKALTWVGFDKIWAVRKSYYPGLKTRRGREGPIFAWKEQCSGTLQWERSGRADSSCLGCARNHPCFYRGTISSLVFVFWGNCIPQISDSLFFCINSGCTVLSIYFLHGQVLRHWQEERVSRG